LFIGSFHLFIWHFILIKSVAWTFRTFLKHWNWPNLGTYSKTSLMICKNKCWPNLEKHSQSSVRQVFLKKVVPATQNHHVWWYGQLVLSAIELFLTVICWKKNTFSGIKMLSKLKRWPNLGVLRYRRYNNERYRTTVRMCF
jgi:hypothetical protein